MRTEDVPAELRNRFCVSDADVEELSRQALVIERHYGRPMDIEWGKDGATGKLYILQARPETVKSRARTTRATPLPIFWPIARPSLSTGPRCCRW